MYFVNRWRFYKGHWGNFLSAMVDISGAGWQVGSEAISRKSGGQNYSNHLPAPLT